MKFGLPTINSRKKLVNLSTLEKPVIDSKFVSRYFDKSICNPNSKMRYSSVLNTLPKPPGTPHISYLPKVKKSEPVNKSTINIKDRSDVSSSRNFKFMDRKDQIKTAYRSMTKFPSKTTLRDNLLAKVDAERYVANLNVSNQKMKSSQDMI